jgi:hypothetical protein
VLARGVNPRTPRPGASPPGAPSRLLGPASGRPSHPAYGRLSHPAFGRPLPGDRFTSVLAVRADSRLAASESQGHTTPGPARHATSGTDEAGVNKSASFHPLPAHLTPHKSTERHAIACLTVLTWTGLKRGPTHASHLAHPPRWPPRSGPGRPSDRSPVVLNPPKAERCVTLFSPAPPATKGPGQVSSSHHDRTDGLSRS